MKLFEDRAFSGETGNLKLETGGQAHRGRKPKSKMKRVLAVDNDELMLEFMKDFLSKEGCEVVTAKDGLSALDTLKHFTPDFIFVDLVMPNIDGKTLCKIIRGMPEFQNTYIIILSGTIAEERIDMAELGANACIAKGPLSEMGKHFLGVLDQPDLASSRSLFGEVIGIESIYPRKMTKELLSVKRHFDLVLDRMSDGVLEITSGGRVVYANPAAISLTGSTQGELLGSRFVDLFAEADQARVADRLKGQDTNPVKIAYDSPVTLNQHLVTLDILPVLDNRTTIIIGDVSALKHEVDRLGDSEARLRTLIEKNTDAMVIINGEGVVKFANPAAETLFGRKSDEIIGTPFGFPVTGGDTTELDLVDSCGESLVAEIRTADMEWEGEKACLASLRDITQRKRMEEDLRKANQKILEQQEKVIEEERLKVLLQVAGATAHEINQPLTALLGNIDLLRLDKDDPERLASHLAEIEAAGKRIADTVRKIQSIRHCDTKPYAGYTTIIDIDQGVNILSVEQSDDDFEKIAAVLRTIVGINLTRAVNIGDAIKKLDQNPMDLILSAYRLPDGNGLDLLETLDRKGIETPVVILTGYGNEMIATELIQAGASDYLTIDRLSKETISQSITRALEKARLNKEIKMAQEKIAEMATRDELTGLYNRRYFLEALERELARAKRHEAGLAICMMDLDHFKRVNDTHGHAGGDKVLSEIGKMIKGWARQSDLCCRYGGEEFAVILPDTSPEGGKIACERLRSRVAQHAFEYEGSRFQITVSIGIAQYIPEEDASPMDLLKRADEALYEAKKEGRNRVMGF